MDNQNEPQENDEKHSSSAKPTLAETAALNAGKKHRERDNNAISSEEDRLQRALEDRMAANQAQAAMTGYLGEEHDSLPQVNIAPFGLRYGGAQDYTILPERMGRIEIPRDAPIWRIELHNLGQGNNPVGLIIAGDVIFGRGSGDLDDSDFDIDEYAREGDGISRRHAMIRPTETQLYILDVGSTNGTMLNGLSIWRSQIRPLAHDDTITMGKFTFTLKITGTPADRV